MAQQNCNKTNNNKKLLKKPTLRQLTVEEYCQWLSSMEKATNYFSSYILGNYKEKSL